MPRRGGRAEVDLAGVARVHASHALWRATGSRPAGRTLVHALASDDQNVRTTAGMLLVKAGKRAEPLLAEALARRENLPLVLTILGDIGDRDLEPQLRRFSEDHDPRVARAARDALRVIDARYGLAH